MQQLWHKIIFWHLQPFSLTCLVFFTLTLKGYFIAAFFFFVFPSSLFSYFPFPRGLFLWAMWMCTGWDIQSISLLLCLKTAYGLFTHTLSIKRKLRGAEREGTAESQNKSVVSLNKKLQQQLQRSCLCSSQFMHQIAFLVRTLCNYLC